jgi:hypothetical protein
MSVSSEEKSEKYVRVHRSSLGIMGLAMLTFFAFDLTDALTDFISTIPSATYMRLLVIPLGFYLVTGAYCLTLSRRKNIFPNRHSTR